MFLIKNLIILIDPQMKMKGGKIRNGILKHSIPGIFPNPHNLIPFLNFVVFSRYSFPIKLYTGFHIIREIQAVIPYPCYSRLVCYLQLVNSWGLAMLPTCGVAFEVRAMLPTDEASGVKAFEV